jgi:hypothetical protein
VPRQEKGKPAPAVSEGRASEKTSKLGGVLTSPNSESLVALQAPPMSRGERAELQQLLRHRERVLRAAAKQRSAELLADFENQLGQIYSFDQDAVWKQAHAAAQAETDKANARIEAQCAKLGIPKRFAPSMHTSWYSRGENEIARRRVELRKMATTRIAAIEQAALVEIGKITVEGQTAIAASGLTTEAAQAFFNRLPPVEALMPQLTYEEIAGEAKPTVVEQLLSPNALRQRRYRERHRDGLRNAADDEGAP